jgi:ATP-dependent Clp protease ATP-binding subunit ClpC
MRARGGLIDHVIGHKEIERVVQIMCRRTKKSNCVGEIQLCWVKTGVGKTTIIEGVALKIANGDVHIFLVVRSING